MKSKSDDKNVGEHFIRSVNVSSESNQDVTTLINDVKTKIETLLRTYSKTINSISDLINFRMENSKREADAQFMLRKDFEILGSAWEPMNTPGARDFSTKLAIIGNDANGPLRVMLNQFEERRKIHSNFEARIAIYKHILGKFTMFITLLKELNEKSAKIQAYYSSEPQKLSKKQYYNAKARIYHVIGMVRAEIDFCSVSINQRLKFEMSEYLTQWNEILKTDVEQYDRMKDLVVSIEEHTDKY